MRLYLAALDANGYTRLLPIAQNMSRLDELRRLELHMKYPRNAPVPMGQLYGEMERVEALLLDTAEQVAIRAEDLFDDKDEGLEESAYMFLTSAFERARPSVKPMFMELGAGIISADRLKALYPQYMNLISSLNMEEFTAHLATIHKRISAEVFRRAITKYNDMLAYCVQNNYALLSCVTD